MSEESPLLEACPACGALLDVRDELPFSQVYCPMCGQGIRARKQFNNFTLIEVLGEGGMGSVFKAIDLHLQREVALKILKRERSADSEERERLEVEAQITASINHPHVVKVYSFGQDHGQFYLAMELVEKGSLDDLMAVQRRVAEVQVLEVGIQIAQGLDAALDRGLIHRDVKPGNILFADPHTAKIVDFGLAAPISEEAGDGEIWGTPYYIAPEKLNHEPEDFRSDLYSLGGTLFHALAGRPPFEAQTASLVALKHMKSQAVSLQAFAPDVSSETAYVINRTLCKDPKDRYSSYGEFIEHMSYARSKLMERAAAPIRPKQRVEVESEQQRAVMGLVWLVIILLVLSLAGGVYLFRDTLFPRHREEAVQNVTRVDIEQIGREMREARELLLGGQLAEADSLFLRIAATEGAPPDQVRWAQANAGICALLDQRQDDAAAIFQQMEKAGMYSEQPEDRALANFFVELGRLMALDRPISHYTIRSFSSENFEAFAIFAFGIKNWELGAIEDAGQILTAFLKTSPKPPYDWIADYKRIAEPMVADYSTWLRAKAATDPTAREKLRGELRTSGSIQDAFDKL